MGFSWRAGKSVPKWLKRRLKLAVASIHPRVALRFPLSVELREAAARRFAQIDWHDSSDRRVIYALTPTANLKNIGDHAQVVAIRQWLERHYPRAPVVEIDKDMAIECIDQIKARVRPNDLVFLHSGGNLGDRGRWSETGRRMLITALPRNRIISLPQTIHFSDTEEGAMERKVTRAIYRRHSALTVLGRDAVSGALAAKLFPSARTGTCPDFVLSLDAEVFDLEPDAANAGKILACLRLDNESAFGPEARQRLFDGLGHPATLFDTTLPDPIPPERRRAVLRETLSLFAGHDTVVTDRYHGLIFAVICRKPTVVLRTIDHKLTSAIEWFSDIPNVRFCQEVERVSDALQEVKAVGAFDYPDFNSRYFDRLPAWLGADVFSDRRRAEKLKR